MTYHPRNRAATLARRPSSIGLFAYPFLLIAIAGTAHADPHVARDDRARVVEDYVLHCSGCHRLDGRGVPEVAPDLRTIGPLLQTDAGRAYLGRVPGVAQAALDDDRLADLLNWVLKELAGVAPRPAYSADEVATLRARPLRDPLAARKALLSPKQ
jgi:mono/diheme cytochrome c family protein